MDVLSEDPDLSVFAGFWQASSPPCARAQPPRVAFPRDSDRAPAASTRAGVSSTHSSRSHAPGLQALPEDGPWDKPDLSRPTPISPPAERGAPTAPAPERLVVLAPVPPQLKHPPHPARSGDAQQSMPCLNTPLRSKRFDAHGGDQESSFRGRGCPPRSYGASAHEKSDRPGRPLSFPPPLCL